MPRYYFPVQGTSWLPDPDGTELPDDEAALEHAHRVIRELMQDSDEFSGWTIQVTQGGERIVGEVPFGRAKENAR